MIFIITDIISRVTAVKRSRADCIDYFRIAINLIKYFTDLVYIENT